MSKERGKGMGPPWSGGEVSAFFDAFHTHGKDWAALAAAVGSRSAAACEAVHTQCAPFLSIPRAIQSADGLAACMRAIYDAEGPPGGEDRAAGPAGTSGGGVGSRRTSLAGAEGIDLVGGRQRRSLGAVPSHVPQPAFRGRRTTARRARPTRKQQAYMDLMLGSGKQAASAPPRAPASRVPDDPRLLGTEGRPTRPGTGAGGASGPDHARKRLQYGGEPGHRHKRHRPGGSQRPAAPEPDAEAVDMLLMLGAAAESGQLDSPAKDKGKAPAPSSASERSSSETTTSAASPPPQDVREDKEAAGPPDGADAPIGPTPPRRRRKPIPERLPTTLSPCKALTPLRKTGALALSVAAGLVQPPSSSHAAVSGAAGRGAAQHPVERRLRRMLSPRARRWAMCEWFYSSLDRPWFMHNEWQEYLAHLGIPPATRLTRIEWGVIRASLGLPRRLSLAFLREERQALEHFRQVVRAKAAQVGPGALPPHLPRPIVVGQRVTALHPLTRTLHDGSVLTVENHKCRVQFDEQQLAVQLVPDVHVAAVDPLENLPLDVARVCAAAGVRLGPGLGGPDSVPSGPPEPGSPVRRAGSAGTGAAAGGGAGSPPAAAGVEPGAAEGSLASEAAAMSMVAAALDKKEALLAELKRMHAEAAALGPGVLPSAEFQAAYAHLVVELKAVSEGKLDPGLEQLARMGPGVRAAALQAQAAAVDAALRQAGLPGQPPGAAPPDCLPEADALLHGALAGPDLARELLPETAAQLGPGRPLRGLLAGCLSLVMHVERFSAAAAPPGAVDAAVDAAAAAITPRCAANLGVYEQIRETLAALKGLLH